MQIKKRWTGRLAAGIFLLCTVGLLWLLWLETVSQREPAPLLPETVDGAPGLDGLFRYAGPLKMEYTLPMLEGQYSMLEIRGLSTAAELLLDGAPFQRLSGGPSYLYMALPTGWAGKTLTLIMEKSADDTVPYLYLTDYVTITEQIGADACYRAFPTAVFGAIFLLALGLFLYGWLEGTRPWPVLLLAAAALGQSAHFYLQNLAVYSLPAALYGLVLHQSRAFLFAAPPLYLLLGMKKYRKIFAPFAVLPSLFYFVFAGFQTLFPVQSGIGLRAGLAFFLTAAALLACSVLEYRDGNPVFRLFLPWLGACAAGLAMLCIVSAARTGALPLLVQAFLLDLGSLYADTVVYYWSTLLLALCLLESVVSQMRRVSERKTEIQVLSARESLTREQLATVQESTAALERFRHDVKNHYLVMQNLQQAGESERLESYLQGLIAEVASIPALAYALHPAINAALTTMLARAQKQGIAVERRVSVPETLPFPDTELCTVLMNLLQNALDANAQAPEGARRWLRVKLYVQGVYLYISVENARFTPVDYDGNSGLCRTTKEDRSAHGYGLKAAQAVARKYGGELLLKFPDGSFSAAIALQMPDSESTLPADLPQGMKN